MRGQAFPGPRAARPLQLTGGRSAQLRAGLPRSQERLPARSLTANRSFADVPHGAPACGIACMVRSGQRVVVRDPLPLVLEPHSEDRRTVEHSTHALHRFTPAAVNRCLSRTDDLARCRSIAIETNEWRRSPRRVQVHFGGIRVADSVAHDAPPPARLPAGLLLSRRRRAHRSPRSDRLHHPLALQGHREVLAPAHARAHRTLRGLELCATQFPGSPDTSGYYGLDWHSMDAWYEENERIYVHARDPLLRVDALSKRAPGQGGRSPAPPSPNRAVRCCSSRPAWSPATTCLRRTCAGSCCSRARPTRCAPTRAAPATTTWKSRVRRIEDAAWQYARPLPSVAAVTGHLAFWSEREEHHDSRRRRAASRGLGFGKAAKGASCCPPGARSGQSLHLWR